MTRREAARISYFDPRRLFHGDGNLKQIAEMDDDTRAGIASFEIDERKVDGVVVGRTTKIKLWDKIRALEMGMRHLGLYERLGKLAGFTLTIDKVVSRPNSVWIVNSFLSHASDQSIKLEWEVRDNGQGPRIADVRIAGVSTSLSKRSEFNSCIMNNGGTVEPLVEELEARAARQ